jgi:hypothetical protein
MKQDVVMMSPLSNRLFSTRRRNFLVPLSLVFVAVVCGPAFAQSFLSVSNVDIDGQGTSATIAPGASFTVSLDYTIWNDATCPTCVAQIVLGIDDDGQDCAYSGIPGVEPGVSGTGAATLTAPSVNGIYEIRYSHELQLTCGLAVDNYDANPPQGNVIGTINVTDFNLEISNVDIDGQGPDATIYQGASFTVSLDYTIWNGASCPTCIAQIVLGIDDDGQDCAYSGLPGLEPGVSGSGTATLTAPSVNGTYEIRYSHELQLTCGLAVDNYDANPPQGNVIGTITVTDFNLEISNVDIDGHGTSAEITQGATFTVNLDYTIWNGASCPGCIAQIVLGIDDDGQDCAYSGLPGLEPGASGSGTATLTAPDAIGTYEIRYSHELQVTCELAVDNYDANPPQGNVLGTIDVTAVAVRPSTWGQIKALYR